MPLIKPRTRGKQLVKHRTRLDRENNETLYAYAQFLGESTEYVLNQLIDTVLARDKEFVQWRAAHQNSFVPGSRAHAAPEREQPSRGSSGRLTGRESRRPSRRRADRGSIVLRTLVEARALVALTLAAADRTVGHADVSRVAGRRVPRR